MKKEYTQAEGHSFHKEESVKKDMSMYSVKGLLLFPMISKSRQEPC